MNMCKRKPIFRKVVYNFKVVYKYLLQNGEKGVGSIIGLCVEHYINEPPFICYNRLTEQILEYHENDTVIYDIQLHPTK